MPTNRGLTTFETGVALPRTFAPPWHPAGATGGLNRPRGTHEARSQSDFHGPRVLSNETVWVRAGWGRDIPAALFGQLAGQFLRARG